MTVLVDIMLWRHLLHVSLPHALVACCGGTCAQAVLLASTVLTIKANLRDQSVAVILRLVLTLCAIYPANAQLHIQMSRAAYAVTNLGCILQAFNKLGESEWSEEARFRTHATVPDQPEAPRLVSAGPTRVVLHWDAPIDNGAPIENYLLERGEGWAWQPTTACMVV